MQYRSGWGTKPKQEGTVGLWLKRSLFDEILLDSVGAFNYSRVQTDEQHALRKVQAKADPNGRIVMQWDPDHLPDGSNVIHRRAVQLGLKGFWRDRVFDNAQGELLGVVDLTEMVARLRPAAEAGADAWEQELEVPRESVYPLSTEISDHIGAGSSADALEVKKIRPSAWTVSPLLTEAECDGLIARAEEAGMVDLSATLFRGLRDCLRVEIDDAPLAETVFHRLKPHIPQEVVVGKAGRSWEGVKPLAEMEGVWRPVECNARWRICCYPGDGVGHFGPHRDGDYVVSSEKRTLLTVNGYLNALPRGSGGSTRFLSDQPLTKDAQGRAAAAEGSVTHSVHPDRPGLATVFFHDLLHDGEPLAEGCPQKWIFRTDVIYQRDRGTGPALQELSAAQEEARKVYAEAEGLEAEDALIAAKLYRRAFKLDPSLEAAIYTPRCIHDEDPPAEAA